MLDGMLGRMLGAARLNAKTFEELEDDSGATVQALVVVMIVAAFSGVGIFLRGYAGLFDPVLYSVLFGVLPSVLGWAIWAFVTFIVGTVFLKGPDTDADWGQIARVTGFAQTPGLLNIFGFIYAAEFYIYIYLAAFLWQFAAMVVGVRQALSYTSIWRAFFVVLISSVFLLIVVTVWGW